MFTFFSLEIPPKNFDGIIGLAPRFSSLGRRLTKERSWVRFMQELNCFAVTVVC